MQGSFQQNPLSIQENQELQFFLVKTKSRSLVQQYELPNGSSEDEVP